MKLMKSIVEWMKEMSWAGRTPFSNSILIWFPLFRMGGINQNECWRRMRHQGNEWMKFDCEIKLNVFISRGGAGCLFFSFFSIQQSNSIKMFDWLQLNEEKKGRTAQPTKRSSNNQFSIELLDCSLGPASWRSLFLNWFTNKFVSSIPSIAHLLL